MDAPSDYLVPLTYNPMDLAKTLGGIVYMKVVPYQPEKDLYHSPNFISNVNQCPSCGAILNKYCSISKRYIKCICCGFFYYFDHIKDPQLIHHADFDLPAIMTNAEGAFKTKDLFIISSAIVTKTPSALKSIIDYSKVASVTSELGVCLLHRNVTMVDFNSTTPLHTFIDEINTPEIGGYFTSSLGFGLKLQSFINRIIEISKSSDPSIENCGNSLSNLIDWASSISGISIRILLDGNTARILNNSKEWQSVGARLFNRKVRISIAVLDKLITREEIALSLNPIRQTGGNISIINSTNDFEIYDCLKKFMLQNVAYNINLSLITSEGSRGAACIYGPGIQDGAGGIELAQIGAHQALFVGVNASSIKNGCIQMKASFTTSVGVRKTVISTFRFGNYHRDDALIDEFIHTAVATESAFDIYRGAAIEKQLKKVMMVEEVKKAKERIEAKKEELVVEV